MKAIVKLSKRVTVEIEEKDEMETLNRAIILTQHPKKCTNCGNEEGLYFTSNKDREGNNYVNIKCPECGGKAKLGQLKVGGFFWHRTFEVYQPKKSSGH